MLNIDFWDSIKIAVKTPTEVDFIELLQQLDQSIDSSTQLPAAGDAIEQLSQIYRDRANAKFEEIEWLRSPQHEPIVLLSEFDRYIRQSCVLDLDRFLKEPEHFYPEQRASAVLSPKEIVADVLSAIIEDDPISIAHEEDVEAWVNQTLAAMSGRSISFLELTRSIAPT